MLIEDGCELPSLLLAQRVEAVTVHAHAESVVVDEFSLRAIGRKLVLMVDATFALGEWTENVQAVKWEIKNASSNTHTSSTSGCVEQ